MSYNDVDWAGTFRTGVQAVAWRPKRERLDDGYDLATALRIVRRMECSAGRAAVYEEIKRKNPLYRVVDGLYRGGGAGVVQPLMLFAYMLKCAVSLGPFDDDGAEAVSVHNFDNERRTVERVAALVPDVRLMRVSVARRHVLRRGQMTTALRMLGAAGRMWPFLMALARSYGFMPSARIASALAYYIRFSRLFADRPALGAAIVASNYSPEAVGMAAAAHRLGRRVVYANHAPIPANGAVVPPVLADCALFYGDATRRTYERRSRCTAEVALIGQPGVTRAMRWREEVETVGIFLTSGTRTDVLSGLVSAIRAGRPGVRILVRNHPVALLKTDLSEIAVGDAGTTITIGKPLDEEIEACDLIVCGNSGVALNALSGGRPVAYMADLDGIRFDSNGFVESGLVCSVSGWSDDIYRQLKAFYQASLWPAVMRSYDARYDADLASLERAAAETLKRHLRPKSAPHLPFGQVTTPRARIELGRSRSPVAVGR